MKQPIKLAFLVWAAISLALVETKGNPQLDFKSLVRIELKVQSALSNGDVRALKQLWDKNAIRTLPDGRTLRGRSAIIAEYHQPVLLSYTFDQIKIHRYGNVAVITGRATGKGAFHSESLFSQSVYTLIYKMTNGKWQIIAQHESLIR